MPTTTGRDWGLYVGLQSDCGVPATELFQVCKGTLDDRMEPETQESNCYALESGDARCPTPTIITDLTGAVDLDFELQYRGHDPLFFAGLGTTETTNVGGPTYPVTVAGNTVDFGVDVSTIFPEGSTPVLYIEGTQMFWHVSTPVESPNTTLDVRPIDGASPPAGAQVVRNTSTVCSGPDEQYLTLERWSPSQGIGFTYVDMLVSSLSYSWDGGIVTASYTLTGTGRETDASGAFLKQTLPYLGEDPADPGSGVPNPAFYTDLTDNSSFSSTRNLIDMVICETDGDDSAATIPFCVQSFDFTIDNAPDTPTCINFDEKCATFGDPNITGNLAALFDADSCELIDAYLNGVELCISLWAPGPDGGTYVFTLPRIRLLSANAPLTGASEQVQVNVTFEALCDENGCFFQVDHFDGITLGALP